MMIEQGAVRSFVAALVIALAVSAAAQQGPARGPIESPRDPALEATSRHNLDVARWYITKRKAYQGGLDRLQEIIDTYPDFSRMDEVYFLMGEASEKLHKPDQAIDHYRQLLKDYPASELAKRTRDRLVELKAPAEAPDNSGAQQSGAQQSAGEKKNEVKP